MWDDINNIKQRLIYRSYDEIIDMLGITEEELVERFEDKIDPVKNSTTSLKKRNPIAKKMSEERLWTMVHRTKYHRSNNLREFDDEVEEYFEEQE